MSDHPMDGLMPVVVSDKMSLARIFYDSELVPKTLDTPAKVFIALQMGHELGLAPMISVSNISAINGKPVIGTDLLVGIAKESPDWGGMDVDYTGEGDTLACKVTVTRNYKNGVAEESIGEFSVAEAKAAGLMGKDVWKKYTKRMITHRAKAFAIRDAFPDRLAGLHTVEEIEGVSYDAEPRAPRDVTPAQPPEPASDMLMKQITEDLTEKLETAQKSGLISEEDVTVTLAGMGPYAEQGANKLADYRQYALAQLARAKADAEKAAKKGKKKAKPAPEEKPEDKPEAPLGDPVTIGPGDAEKSVGESPELKDAKGKTEMLDGIDNMAGKAEATFPEQPPDVKDDEGLF